MEAQTFCRSCSAERGLCAAPHEKSDGFHHWWSGWPGAYCLGCGCSDPQEECLGDDCRCSCHPAPPTPAEWVFVRDSRTAYGVAREWIVLLTPTAAAFMESLQRAYGSALSYEQAFQATRGAFSLES